MLRPRIASRIDREQELCRICFSKTRTCLNVFETSITSQMTIADMFMHFLGENMNADDHLPEYICCDCLEEAAETRQISQFYKSAVGNMVWRCRLQEVPLVGNHKSVIGKPSTLDVLKIFSGDYGMKERNIFTDIERNSINLATVDGTKSSGAIRDDVIISEPKPVESTLHDCMVCRGVFLSADELTHHYNLFHQVQDGFRCGKCYRLFKSIGRLERHVEKYSFGCKSKVGDNFRGESESVTSSPAPEKETSEGGNQDGKYCCDKCGSRFRSGTAARIHSKETHSATLPCICGVCNRVLPTRLDLEWHKLNHEKEHSCDLCGMEFYTIANYKTHLNLHHRNMSAHKCPICGEQFSSKRNLRIHLKRHSSVKKVECSICHTKFNDLSRMSAHMRSVHQKLKPHNCGICHMSFSLKSILITHLALHSDQRPFKCTKCEKTFKSQCGKRNHERLIHKIFKPKKVFEIVDEQVLEKIRLSN